MAIDIVKGLSIANEMALTVNIILVTKSRKTYIDIQWMSNQLWHTISIDRYLEREK